MMKRALVTLFLILPLLQFAQTRYSITKKKAITAYEEALSQFTFYTPDKIDQLLVRALKIEPDFKEAHILRGQNFFRMGNIAAAESELEVVVNEDPDFFSYAVLLLGEAELIQQKYDEAEEHVDTYLRTAAPGSENYKRAKQMLKNIQFAQDAILNPVPFDPINLGPNINTATEEYYPCLTTDDQTMYFTRLVKDDPQFQGKTHEDFFTTSRKSRNDKWAPSKNMGYKINTSYNEGAPSISADGKILFYTACEMWGDLDYGANRKGYGSCDMFYAVNEGGKWSKPVNMGAAVNTRAWETQPSFSSDGQNLYFVRGFRRGGREIQGIDIWKTTLTDFNCLLARKTNCFTKAEKLGEQINTDGNEVSVLIHPDGKTLYFSSTGHPGMGGEDLYLSRMDEFGNWGPAENLGYPINSPKDENSLMVTANGKVAYFASDREGGFGGLDLYQFELPKNIRPTPVTYFRGKVYDKETGKPLAADFRLVDISNNREVVKSQSDRVDGSFMVSIPGQKNYALSVVKPGYLFYSESFFLENSDDPEKPFEKEVPLIPIKKGEKVVLKNIFFASGKSDLASESYAELDKLFLFLNNNPTMSIEIGGHTDNVGSDEDNLVLSDDRARVVKEYLINKGIADTRLQSKGYGETEPIESNETEAGRAENRRTEFKVL